MNKSFLSVLMLLLVGTLFVGCSDDNVQLEGNELISEDNFEESVDELVEDVFESDKASEEDIELGELI